MSKVLITEQYLEDIADAIRAKHNTDAKYTPNVMATAITNIPTSGGGEGTDSHEWEDMKVSGSYFFEDKTPVEELVYTNDRVNKVGNFGLAGINLFSGITDTVSNSELKGTVNLPNVTEIGISGFYFALINKVIAPKLKIIGTGAFESCDCLYVIDAPLVEKISPNAFQKVKIRKIDFPNVKELNGSIFNNANIKEIRFPNVEFANSYEFYYIYDLIALFLPKIDTAESRDTNFGSNNSLETIYVPELTIVTNSSFKGCSKLCILDLPKVASIKGSASYNGPFNNSNNLKHLILRNETLVPLSTSASNTFGSSSPIITGTGWVYVPSALVDEYKSATNWSTIADQIRAIEDYEIIANGMSGYWYDEDITSIEYNGSGLFYNSAGNEFTTGIDLPNLTSIQNRATGTKEDHAFVNFTNLAYVNLPNVTEINGFSGCGNLKLVNIPKAKTIGVNCFGGCNALKEIDLPETLTTIKKYGFRGCSSLNNVICRATTPPTLAEDAFANKFTLFVPQASIDAYRNSDWANHYSSINPIEKFPRYWN